MVKKICMLGNPAVGKTSLVANYVFNVFKDTYLSTIGAKPTKKQLQMTHPVNNLPVNLTMIIWDIAGHNTFQDIHKTYYRGAEGALIVCDVTSRESLQAIPNWLTTFYEVVGVVPVILLANKSDLMDQAVITEDDLKKVANAIESPYFFTSAKTGDHVETSFSTLATDILSMR